MAHHGSLTSTPATAISVEGRGNVDLVPGTEVMIDVLGTTNSDGSSSQNAQVLIPQPTNDPSDPLVSQSAILFFLFF